MLTEILSSSSLTIIVMVMLCLIVAGLMKGIIGVGMPIVALPLVSMFIDVKAAVMLLTVPLVLSNIPQALEGGETLECLVRLIPVLVGMMPGILIGVLVLLKSDPSVAKTVAGMAVMLVAVLTLLAPKFRLRESLQMPVGIAAGFLGGALGGVAAMPGPLVFTFLLSKGLRGKDFTKEASLFLVLSAALLAGTLASSYKFDWVDLAISALALAPVAVGMFFGQKLRDMIDEQAFKKIVLLVVLASGAGLLLKGLSS
ncbi:MAG: sulfite exporter TauE/SafE family protein [Rhodopseudomonas sp.]|uniref:sulfite exporter TauE/SafE family protein n=1 Tax=Rhodopseudomonas sp. TaxID=1078 RepID=UPI0018469F0B|nr:sulfite exporter TauE/SafE family protein [Rhodopseudomonas sp.]NVN87289.1 sulfite exporter TauE/SafE family protein [Rhodopseudomonas sp.]